MNNEEMTIFLTDYLPLLNPSSIQAYLFLTKYKDKNNVVSITYAEFAELGMANSTITAALQQLRSLGLIGAPPPQDQPAVSSASRHEIVPIRSFSMAKRKQIFGEKGKEIDSGLRNRLLDTLPLKYRTLLSKKKLTDTLKELGRDNFSLKSIADHLGLNIEVVRLLASGSEFCNKFKALKGQILGEIGSKESKSLKKEKKKEEVPYEERHEALLRSHIDKNGDEIPVEKWGVVQFIRLFCLLFEEYNGIYPRVKFKSGTSSLFTNEGGPIAKILKSYNNPVTVKSYFEWVFEAKNEKLDRPISAGFLGSESVMTEFDVASRKKKGKRGKKATNLKRADSIDSSYIEWVKAKYPLVLEEVDFAILKDLYWMKHAYDEGRASKYEKEVIEEGIRRGLVPKEGNLALNN